MRYKNKLPKILFKYKNPDKLEYLFDIWENNRIYFPRYNELNDPLEGAGKNIKLVGWAGMTMHIMADDELEPIESCKRQYGILSLTEDSCSPQMWAYYGGNYKGLCLCFRTNSIFSEAKRLVYSDHMPEKNVGDDIKILNKYVYDGFLRKSVGWKYEKEWRVIRKFENDGDNGETVSFAQGDLVGVILGHEMDDDIKKAIRKSLPDNVKVFKTRICYQEPRVAIQDIDYEYIYNGERQQYIDNVEDYLLGE